MAQITVLMSIYNEPEEYLTKSIDSILNQTYRDFIFLIILDNPSNEPAVNLLKNYQKKDERIQYFINERNLGLPATLNRGIETVTTSYIARMDADDIATIDRLEKQLLFLENNPEISLVGANVIYIDSDNRIIKKKPSLPQSMEIIPQALKIKNVFNHPTFMGRTSVFKTLLYRELEYSQDYDFICRLIELGYKSENLTDYLLYYRLTDKVSDSKRVKQRIVMQVVQKMYRKNKLSSTDINQEVIKMLNSINQKKLIDSINKYEEAFNFFEQGKRFESIKILFTDAIVSKYQRENLRYLIKIFISKLYLKER